MGDVREHARRPDEHTIFECHAIEDRHVVLDAAAVTDANLADEARVADRTTIADPCPRHDMDEVPDPGVLANMGRLVDERRRMNPLVSHSPYIRSTRAQASTSHRSRARGPA